MKTGALFLVFALKVVAVLSQDAEEQDSTDSEVDVDYETVTRIIEALKSSKSVPAEDVEESTVWQAQDEVKEQNSEDDETYEKYAYEYVPSNVLQKRKLHRKIYRKPICFIDTEIVEDEPLVVDGPCEVEIDDPEEHVYDSEEHIYHLEQRGNPIVGSQRGTPGVDYPNYSEIPMTSFTCADKKRIPGFYADVETGCQVFHVCYPHRRESFLCPPGTIFNQPILACDYWYNFNCSTASSYFEIHEQIYHPEILEEMDEPMEEELLQEPELPEPELPELAEPELPELAEPELLCKPDLPCEPELPCKPDLPCEPELPCKPDLPCEPEFPVTEPPEEVFTIVVETLPPDEPIVIPHPEVPVVPVVEVQPKPVPIPVVKPKVVVKAVLPDLATVGKFFPVKAKVTKVAVPVATVVKAASVKVAATPVKVAKVKATKFAPVKAKVVFTKAVPFAKVAKAAAAAGSLGPKILVKTKMATPLVKPVVIKKALAKKILLAKAAKGAKLMTVKSFPAVSALTKKHLVLSLLKMAKAKKLII